MFLQPVSPCLSTLSWRSTLLQEGLQGLNMRYSQLAAILTLLLKTYGEVSLEDATHLQEDCCGEGNISAAARMFGMVAGRRDVSCRHAEFCNC